LRPTRKYSTLARIYLRSNRKPYICSL